jgi:excisionase family DNA binding protein
MPPQSQDASRQNELMTAQEVADYFRVSRVTVWRWCKEGIIPAFRIGRNWRIRRDKLADLEEILNADSLGPKLDED